MTTVVAYFYDLENRTSINKKDLINNNQILSRQLENLFDNKTESTMFNKYSDLYNNVNILIKEFNRVISIKTLLNKIFFDGERNNSLFEMYLVISYLEEEYHLELFTLIITSLVGKQQLINLISEFAINSSSLDSACKAIDEYYSNNFVKMEINKINLFFGIK